MKGYTCTPRLQLSWMAIFFGGLLQKQFTAKRLSACYVKRCQGLSKGRVPARLSGPPGPAGVAGWTLAVVLGGEQAKSPEPL